MKKPEVLVIGSINYDFIIGADRLPFKGETMTANSLTGDGGGKGANQAVQAAKLGIKTYMAGAVGTDDAGKNLIESMRKYEVDTKYIKTVDGYSGMGFVHAMTDGSVYATIIKGANESIKKTDIDNLSEVMENVSVVVLQLEIPVDVVEYAIEVAYSKNCKIILNTAPAKEMDTSLFKKCALVVMNEVEAEFYIKNEINNKTDLEKYAIRYADEKQTNLIITLGEKGSALCSAGEVKLFEPVKTNVVETTGAGDSFIGGLAYGIVNNLSYDEMMIFAGKCSSVTITRVGAQNSMPTIQKIENLN